ncbi:MAG TPA: ABC transporter substrate-binding protein [Chloroflexia bacterium]|nr:ABC transporter substrate-binding protein [Chloroflexia bacterium]
MNIPQRIAATLLLATLAAGALAGCGDTTAATPTAVANTPATATSAPAGTLTKFRLQLKWLHQAQFAGYYVAADKGYYKDQGLDVEILPGGPDVVPSQKVLTGVADAGIDWVGSLLANRDQGQPLVDVAQFYQSSGLYLISKKKAGINSPADLKGKKVGVWTGGNEFEFRALMDKYKFDNSIDNNKDMTIIKQGFEMDTFLGDKLDAASAMVYNEYPVVLEAGVKPEELNVISYNAEGVGMLEDHIFVTEQTMRDKKDVLTRFLAASQKGWIAAIQDQPAAVAAVMSRVDKAGTTQAHQETMMKEVAKLVQPAGLAPEKIGFVDPAKFQTTADIALKFNVISKPAQNAYSNDLMDAAAKLNAK